MRLVR